MAARADCGRTLARPHGDLNALVIGSESGSVVNESPEAGVTMKATRIELQKSRVVQRRNLLKKFAKAWGERDIDTVMACMTSNCVYEASVGPEPGTTFQGADQVRRGILQMFTHDEGSTARISNLFITGTQAAWEWTYYWSNPAGRNRAVRGCDVFEFSGEKIRRKSGFRKTTRS